MASAVKKSGEKPITPPNLLYNPRIHPAQSIIHPAQLICATKKPTKTPKKPQKTTKVTCPHNPVYSQKHIDYGTHFIYSNPSQSNLNKPGTDYHIYNVHDENSFNSIDFSQILYPLYIHKVPNDRNSRMVVVQNLGYFLFFFDFDFW